MNTERNKDGLIAVIGFSDRASPLEPLWPSTHRALIPIAGKPLIVHLVEQLANAGIRHIRVAGSIQQYAVRNRLRCGREWGMTIRYSDLHGDELLAECLATEARCLYLLGDHLYDADFGGLGANSARSEKSPDIEQGMAGIWRIDGGDVDGHSLVAATGRVTYVNPLVNALDYHHANLRAVRGFLPRLNVPGTTLHEHAIADWQAEVAADARIGSSVFIGKHCRVGQLARLESDCVLANGVVLESGARLENVSVLPNCFVGRHMSMRDAVIGADGVLALDGRFWPVRNGQLLGPTRDNLEYRTGLPDRNIVNTTR